MDNREFTRVTPRFLCDIEAGATRISGEVRDLSLGGLWLPTMERLPVQTPCRVTIHLAESVQIRAEGLVIRSEPDGIAVRFVELIGLESYEYLRDLILFNAGEPSAVQQEFNSHLGLLRVDPSHEATH